MIKYALGCHQDHEFEGWFASSEEFARLKTGKHLDCPVCGSRDIEKRLMAPSVKSTKGKERQIVTDAPQLPTTPPTQMPVAAAPALPALAPEIQQQLVNHLREMKRHVLENAENVGKKFGEEVRKIHYGEAEERGIYGQTSLEEAVELLEEGISILPLPDLPEEKN